MLDAGCGSGQKTEILARLCSEQNVLGLDLAVEPLEEAVASFSTRPNLDYVQGNILEPPFKAAQFDYGVSIGALHHTPDTRKAFTVFRRLLKDDTTCLIWIYPTYKEGPEWQPPYFARDFLLLNQGHRIPPRFLRWIAYMLVLANYPIVDFHFRQHFRRIKKDLPFFDIDRMTRRERFSAEVFFAFDTCLPRYQFRHTIKEVESWFIEEGLVPIAHAHSFYWASTPSRN
jgi:SAM-dependent methyltransferase